jgi:RNA polymerase sigma-70 factor (ECF subfamily)
MALLSPVVSLPLVRDASRRPAEGNPSGRGGDEGEGSERELVRRARGGDAAAREALAIAHRRAAYLLALQLMGNRDDALDATQDALLRFFSTLHRFRPEQPVRPWLYSIVRNRCRDLLRRGRVRRAEPLEAEPERWRPELVDASADPELDAERAELRRKVFAALGELAPEHREILVLRDYQDLSYQEIAEVLRVPRGTVMSRLHRARKALGATLRAAGALPPLPDAPAEEAS